jgi:hypothetical protein
MAEQVARRALSKSPYRVPIVNTNFDNNIRQDENRSVEEAIQVKLRELEGLKVQLESENKALLG